MWRSLKTQLNRLFSAFHDDNFLINLHQFEKFTAKILALSLVVIVLVSLFDLIKILTIELASEPLGFFTKTLIELFGLILNILIAMELLENITGYLKKNVIQVELVIVTSIIAVARKVIIFDFNKYNDLALFALGFVTLCLAVSYWLLKQKKS